jgi:hypothetical protein
MICNYYYFTNFDFIYYIRVSITILALSYFIYSKQTYAILTGLSLGLSFKFFEYLSFEFEFEYFENLLQISNKII